MNRGDPTLGNLLFILFTAITVVGTFFIAQHFHSRRLAIILSLVALILFGALYFALEAFMQWLGL